MGWSLKPELTKKVGSSMVMTKLIRRILRIN